MTAKEMFEELGYKYEKVHSEYFDWTCDNIHIRFWDSVEKIETWGDFLTMTRIRETTSCVFTAEELKAITQQCKELGWLEGE